MLFKRTLLLICCGLIVGTWSGGCKPEGGETDGDADVDADGDADSDGDVEPACPDDWACCENWECSDGIFCNGLEVCDRGICEQDPDAFCTAAGVCQVSCDDGIECTEDACNEQANVCEHRPNHDACLDDDLCDGDERCDPADAEANELGCVDGMPLICDDGDNCTDDYCEEDVCRTRLRDADGDGHGDDDCQRCDPENPDICERGDDCNDANADVYPGAPEICEDGEDNNCDRIRDYADPACVVPYDTCGDALLLEPDEVIHASTRRTRADIDSSCSAAGDPDVAFVFAIPAVRDVEIEVDVRGGRAVTVALTADCGNPAADMRCTTGRAFTQISRALEAGTYYVVVSSGLEADFDISLRVAEPAPRPEGDQCATAPDISEGGTFDGTTRGFDPDYEATCGDVTDRDAAFRVTLDETAAMNVRVTAPARVAVAVQSACGVVATEAACFTGEPAEGWVRHLAPGTHYIIVKSGVELDFEIEIEFMPTAANECADVRDVSDGGHYRGSTHDMDASIDTACGDPAGPDGAYEFTIDREQDVLVNFGPATERTFFSLSSDCGDPSAELRCSVGREFELRGRGLGAGTYYLIATGEDGGDFEFDIEFRDPVPRPPADLCTGAVDVTGGGSFSGSTEDAENDYDSRCGEATDLDVAYRFTLAEARSMDLTVTAETGPITVAIQPDCGVLGTERGCFTASPDADRHYRNLDAGTYYLIFKTPVADAFDFTLSFGPPEDAIPLPFIALPYDFFEWDVPAANLILRAVSYGYDGAMPIVGAVQECADLTGGTSSANPGGPYAGEYNSTLGALRWAGLPPDNIIEIVDQRDAAARLGTYDVLLFMECERGAPDATAWRPTIEAHLSGGGRMVITYPGTGASFINALGLFGEGASGSASTPYTTEPHPFWDGGLVHPGRLNATSAWRWSGTGLVPLARAAVADTYTVWGYETDF